MGGHLAKAFRDRGCDVVIVSRSPAAETLPATVPWAALRDVVEGAQAVINLAGSNVGAQRWSPKVRQEILQSRIDATRQIVTAIGNTSKPPALINASGVGFYGNTMVPSNEAMGAGQTFLARVTSAWEDEALKACRYTRVAILRLGVVLDAHKGALARLALPMKLGIGGPLGSGSQWFPWIHRTDAVNAFVWAALDAPASGAYNVVAPESVTVRTMANTLGQVLHRPCWLPAPSAILRLMLGRQADLVLHGQNVIPMRLLGEHFVFQFPTLKQALHDLYTHPRIG